MPSAPVIIFAFNRLEPLKSTVTSLLRNSEAILSDLYVFVDGARQGKDGEEQKVSRVREYVKGISGFKSLTCKFSQENKGLGPSIIAGVSEVLSAHGRAIVLEDDLEVAPGFLSYMNTMLDAYEKDSRIMQVSGYSTKVSLPEGYAHDIYLNRRGESWSWATWKDRWDSIDWEVSDYQALLADRKQQKAFNDIGSDMFGMLSGYMEGRNKSWAIRFCYSMFRQGCFQVSPVRSLVRNEGFNADSTNCNTFDRYESEFNADQSSFTPVPGIEYVKSIDKSANKYWSIPYRIYGKVRTILGF